MPAVATTFVLQELLVRVQARGGQAIESGRAQPRHDVVADDAAIP